MSGVLNVLAIAQRELKSYFVSPVAYVVTAFFLLVAGYLFALILLQSNEATLRYLQSNLSVIWLFVAPFLTMRLLAEEQRTGTIELLLTSPVRGSGTDVKPRVARTRLVRSQSSSSVTPAPSRNVTVPLRAPASYSTFRRSRSAAKSMSSSRAVAATLRNWGAMAGEVRLPNVPASKGVKSVSAMTSSTCSTPERSSSATTWASEVRMFWPTSVLPV